MLMRGFLLTLLSLCVIVAVALWAGPRFWNGATSELTARLAASSQPTLASVYSDRELEGLPAPVARYLRQVLPAGQPMIRRTRIEWRGEFNMGHLGADNWKAFLAHQAYVVDPPGFVWDARVAMAPALPVLVRDMFLAGQGSMRGKIAGWVTVLDAAPTP
ncbi:MAG: hypothetical protein Q8K46_07235, partial [Deltaproteobacteria bacterium]|nr:hypothetical protein [Deltaproteobacteria bacterium]